MYVVSHFLSRDTLQLCANGIRLFSDSMKHRKNDACMFQIVQITFVHVLIVFQRTLDDYDIFRKV